MNQSLFLSHPFSFYPKDTWHSSRASRDCLKQLPYYCLSIVSQVFQSFSHSSIFPIILPINPYFCLRYPDPVNWHTSSSQPQRGKSIVWILSCRHSSELLGASNSLFFTFGLCEDQSLQLMYHCPLCSQERPRAYLPAARPALPFRASPMLGKPTGLVVNVYHIDLWEGGRDPTQFGFSSAQTDSQLDN